MRPFDYIDSSLAAGPVRLADIAAEVGTPAYVYSADAIEAAYREFERELAPARICYAMKANGNLAVLRLLAGLGAGADVVSEGEFRRALAAGIAPDRIVFSGVGKTDAEMEAALASGIFQINVESAPEVRSLSRIAARLGRTASVAVRINPDVDARTLDQISTGRKTDKFGVAWTEAPALFREAAGLPGLSVEGIAVHIGSQLGELEPYRRAFRRVAELARTLAADGIRVRRLDLGGGFGIRYRDETPLPLAGFAGVVEEEVGGLDCEIVVEPGRRLVGPAGVLLARVIAVKETPERRFVIVDAGMNDLVRPMMYGAWHDILPLAAPPAGAEYRPADVVGPVCETTDRFAEQRLLPPLAAGDLVAFCEAGAYGAVMASTYNGRPLAPEVLVRGSRFDVVRARPGFEESLALESVPDWLAGSGGDR
ncbi:MAG: diaminopimelate decarboxylase [Alphaproteobacteria bacterium]|nr:diaminopimelate decarboxylase [Alphaproteobacteria bacterium]